MKANEAPEIIYCETDGYGNVVRSHNQKWPDEEAENVEYIRTDVFINKTCTWFRTLDDKEPPYKTTEEFIEGFKKAINV